MDVGAESAISVNEDRLPQLPDANRGLEIDSEHRVLGELVDVDSEMSDYSVRRRARAAQGPEQVRIAAGGGSDGGRVG